jgi:Asp-tRNA(Asn)/Glu-tRNA(Gln) amidotransferase A subunit family amidase
VELLEESGAIVAGKTNLDEFGMGWVQMSFGQRSVLT